MSTQGADRAAEDAPALSIKHWRSFGPADWGHVREGVVGLLLGSVLPVVLFYLTLRNFGFNPAVVVVLTWSALVFLWHLRRTGRADVFSATTFAFACVKAAAGLVSQNGMLYLAFPSFENLAYGTLFVVSALLGAPILAMYAQRLYPIPRNVRHSDTFKRAFIVTSFVWLFGHSLRGLVRLTLMVVFFGVGAILRGDISAVDPRSLELYLLADTVAGWPINISLIAFTTWYPLRQLHKAGFMNVQPVELSVMDTVELVIEEAEPTTV